MSKSICGVTGVALDLEREPDVGIDGADCDGHAKYSLSICDAEPSEVLALTALRASERIPRRKRAQADDNLVLVRSFFDSVPYLFDGTCQRAGSPAIQDTEGPTAWRRLRRG